MWPYWFLLIVPAYLAVTRHRLLNITLSNEDNNLSLIWKFIFISLTLMIGWRHQVGGDWYNYLEQINYVQDASFVEALASKDPAYSVLSWLGAQSGTGVYFVNLVCAVFFSTGLISFCRSQPKPWLALTIAVPYLVTVVAMGYSRQGVAIGIEMLGLVALSKGNNLRFVLLVCLAATFHKSAIILLPLAVLSKTQRRFFALFWVCVTGIALYVLLLQESLDNLFAGYIEAEYQSSGAAIRVAMNALPAVLFLGLKHRFEITLQQRNFWTWMSWGALLFVVLLLLTASSTAVDRLALYWIPLQLFLWSRLPQAMGHNAETQLQWSFVVLVYAFTVHFVWLFFADNRMGWLPYKFFPWEWLWS